MSTMHDTPQSSSTEPGRHASPEISTRKDTDVRHWYSKLGTVLDALATGGTSLVVQKRDR